MRRSLFWLLDQYAETGESLASLQATALEHAELADRLSFESLWLAEHHFRTLGTAANPAVLLAALAQRTERLRLGPAVCVLPLRNPIQVAEDYALVDVLSGGRLNMGVGSGSRLLEFEGFGADFEDRRRMFDRNLDALQDLWSGACCTTRGVGALNVAPLQKPSPPIYVATMREEGSYEAGLAGHSLLTLVSPATADPSEVAARVEAHAHGLKKREQPAGAAEAVVVAFAHVAGSAEGARRVAAPALGRLLHASSGAAPPDPGGAYDMMVERDTGLFGTAEQVARQIDRYAALGVGHMAFVSRFGGMDAEAARQTLRELSPATRSKH